MIKILDAGIVDYPSIKVETREGSDINNSQIKVKLPLWEEHTADVFRQKHNFAIVRSNRCGYYNCHGLTFASRRTRIFDSNDIMTILQEDNYKEIDVSKVLPGDIVMYFRNGDPQHSGVIVSVPRNNITDSNIIAVSKWGNGDEFIHNILDCPYIESARIIYYRIQSVLYGERK